jgi:hypothetical protein
MRRVAILVLSLVVMVAMATAAFAQNVHLKGGRNAEPSFTDGGLFLSASGELAGLGGGDVVVNLDATGNATATCTNPGTGVHQPPGQNPAPISVSGAQRIPESEIKNGNTPFDVSTEGPVTPVPGAPDCPNPNWIEDITDLAFTSAVITVEQPPGTVVLTVTCTFDPATSDGPVPGGTVSCTSS